MGWPFAYSYHYKAKYRSQINFFIAPESRADDIIDSNRKLATVIMTRIIRFDAYGGNFIML